MIQPAKEFSIDWAGRKLTIATDQLAQQANGACTVRYGDTVVLCTAVMGDTKEEYDHFPLMVDFEERMYAAGRIKGSRFVKRDGRATDEAILSGRMIDRAVRPLFPSHITNEVAVVTTVLSHDGINDADILGLIGTACALAISDIPWTGPIAAIRIGRVDGKFIAMPTYVETETGDLDLVVSGTADKTIMVEAGASQVGESEMLEAMKLAHDNILPVIDLIKEVVRVVGKPKVDPSQPKDDVQAAKHVANLEAQQKAWAYLESKRGMLFAEPLRSKADRKAAVSLLKKSLVDNLGEIGIGKDEYAKAVAIMDRFVDNEVTKLILDEKRRADGRAFDEIRPLGTMVGLIPRAHGSGLFERGATQVLSAVTLGSPGMEMTLDTMEFQGTKRYFHHYNFPGFAVGETKGGGRGPGRREIGHGALAERAIMPVLPSKEDFPYTVRVVSEVLGSNGSSSMGATCGSTLALLNAGVPLSEPVAGIAMGLASDEKAGRYQVITDLQDLEDGTGGMDFKIAGTRNGITAIQLDTKTTGLPWNVVVETLEMAKKARLQILDEIKKTIGSPGEMSKFAPRIESFRINPDKIRDVIGPGGKMINGIIEALGVEIDIEDDGLVMVTSTNPESMQRAVEWIKELTREVAVGEVFEGEVVRIMPFGAFVNILPKVDGLVHISEMAAGRVNKVEDVVNIGDTVKVVVYEIDSQGRINLSMKRAEEGYEPSANDSKPLRDGSGPTSNGRGKPTGRGPRRYDE